MQCENILHGLKNRCHIEICSKYTIFQQKTGSKNIVPSLFVKKERRRRSTSTQSTCMSGRHLKGKIRHLLNFGLRWGQFGHCPNLPKFTKFANLPNF